MVGSGGADAVWERCIAWTKEDEAASNIPQDVPGRLADVLNNAIYAIRASTNNGASYLHFGVNVVKRPPLVGREELALKIHIGPGDTPEPVMTIMMEDED